jgi:hypothetical protein
MLSDIFFLFKSSWFERSSHLVLFKPWKLILPASFNNFPPYLRTDSLAEWMFCWHILGFFCCLFCKPARNISSPLCQHNQESNWNKLQHRLIQALSSTGV